MVNNDELVAIRKSVLDELTKYLGKRPFEEVYTLLGEMQKDFARHFEEKKKMEMKQ